MANRLVPIVLALGFVAASGCGGNSPVQPTPATVPALPASPVPQGAYTLSAGAKTVVAGSDLSVSWTASQAGKLDWIALFRVTDTNLQYGNWYEYVNAVNSGTLTMKAPTEVGQYEFRYLLDDGYRDVARSAVVTVEVK
jgi:hypothetical protein